jgi:hypothetical protein
VLLLAVLPLMLVAFVEEPLPGFTGGFGEPTCHQCHFDNSLNDPAGELTISGLPEHYTPGARYQITVRVSRPALGRAGFQLAARFGPGGDEGRQAGHLQRADERTVVIPDRDRGIQYAQHTFRGTLAQSRGEVSWTVEWTAPASSAAPVLLHVVANATNDDGTPLGDFVYRHEARSLPGRGR